MANKENIRKRLLKENPKAVRILDDLDKELAQCPPGVTVTITPDMTPEEENMALLEGFLKEGYSIEIAEQKAKQWRELAKKLMFPLTSLDDLKNRKR